MIETASRINSVQEYYFSRKLQEIRQLESAGKDIINLGIGNPDLLPPKEVISELEQLLKLPNVHGYQSYQGHPEFRQSISDFYEKWFAVDLNPDTEILPLIGSKEGLMHLAMTYLEAGSAALVPNPGYPAYSAVTKLAGATVCHYELLEENSYLPDLEALRAIDLSKVKIMFLNYPHMPTGSPMDLEVMTDLIALAIEHDILLVHDNPYAFILNDHPRSIMEIPGAKDCCVELNSLSKSFNMAGWRVGMMVGDEKVINQVLRFKSNMDSGMFLPVQRAAAKALSLGSEWFEQNNSIYRHRKSIVFEMYDTLGVSYNPDQVGLFVWGKVTSGYASGYEMSDAILYNADVFITPGGIFGSAGEQYVRTSLCVDEEIIKEALIRITNKL